MKKVILVFIVLLVSTTVHAKIQQTLWKPDTCGGCEVVYEWDDTQPQDLRVHTAVSVKNEHPDFSSFLLQDKYGAILEKNQRKNIAISEIIKDNPSIKAEDIQFSYDESHVLHLVVPGLADKASEQGKLNAKIGNNKVIID